jgi:hypothetical protein
MRHTSKRDRNNANLMTSPQKIRGGSNKKGALTQTFSQKFAMIALD